MDDGHPNIVAPGAVRLQAEPRPSKGPRQRGRRVALLGALVGAGFLGACAPAEETVDEGRVNIVTTIGMITDLTERIGGDRVRVTGLMGPGIDPHLYRASAGDVRTLSSADLIFYGGLHLEAAMAEVLEEMNGRIRTKAVTDDIPRGLLLDSPQYQGQYDPHVWFDVTLWTHAAQTIAATLIEVDPDGEPIYRANAEALVAELAELDAWVRERVSELPEPRRILVTAHDAFNYFGRAYGFRVEGILGLSTATEAGTGDVQRIVQMVLETGVPAIFVESSIPQRYIEAVQAAVRDTGRDVAIGGLLFSDAMGDPGTDEGTYPGMVRHNVNTIVDALLAGEGEGGA
jgi:manganese/zinc/iron transport system substrate-binding protein